MGGAASEVIKTAIFGLWGTILPAHVWGTIVRHTYFVLFLREFSTWLKDPPKTWDMWSDFLLVAELGTTADTKIIKARALLVVTDQLRQRLKYSQRAHANPS